MVVSVNLNVCGLNGENIRILCSPVYTISP